MMNYIHKELASGKWQTFSFMFQMGNIASDVSRVIMLHGINKERSMGALQRALELLDLTIEDPKNINRLKELRQLRKALADYFCVDNVDQSTDQHWTNYFYPFAYAAAIDRENANT